jgi:hypothetical protein
MICNFMCTNSAHILLDLCPSISTGAIASNTDFKSQIQNVNSWCIGKYNWLLYIGKQ